MEHQLKGSEGGMTRAKRSNALPPPPMVELRRALDLESLTIEWLAGDGSDRCYYRIRSPQLKESYVLMQLSGTDAEALAQGRYDWLNLAAILEQEEIITPRVVACIPDYAALVIQDYGDTMLESAVKKALNEQNIPQIENYYRNTFQILGKMLKISQDADAVWCRRSFDEERLGWEMRFFYQQTLHRIGHRLPADFEKRFAAESQRLTKQLGAEAKYFVHRDFHSRNLMLLDDRLAVIDFQDARLGTASYDLVSLVFDPYVDVSVSCRMRMLRECIEYLSHTVSHETLDSIKSEWPLVLIQRQLKAIGSYGFLTFDKKRGDYLQYVIPAIHAVREAVSAVSEQYPLLGDEIWQLIEMWVESERAEENS